MIFITFVPVPLLPLLPVFILVGIALLGLKNYGLLSAFPEETYAPAPYVVLSGVCLKIRKFPLDDPDLSCFFWFYTHEIKLSFDN